MTRSILPLLACFFIGCGPVVLKARGTVLNPAYTYGPGDMEAPRPPRILIIHRHENRIAVRHTYVVAPGMHLKALEIVGEYAEIPMQHGVGDGLYIETIIFSNYKDELAGAGMDQYAYWLELPDGRKIKGEMHVQGPLHDFSSKITGMHVQPYMTVRDHANRTQQTYSYLQEVEDDVTLYARRARILFMGRGIISPKTRYVIFVVRGFQRERRYRFDFTEDPYAAMADAIRRGL